MVRELKHSLEPRTNLKTRLIARLHFSNILKMPEPEFARLVAEIESDPVFQKLVYPEDLGMKAVLRRRFQQTRISSSFYEVKEQISAGSEDVDVEKILAQHKGIVELIRKIGQPNFERYFLYREGSESLDSIAENCALSKEEVLKIQSVVTELSVHSEFFHPSTLAAEGGLHYTLIARLEFDEKGAPVVSFLSPHLASGRYIINPDRLSLIRKRLNSDERKALTHLVHRMELANLRYDSMNRILRELMARQDAYLRSRDEGQMSPLPQRAMAERIEVAPSTVCRAIYAKSVLLPWGEEKPLKDFFLPRKEAAERWVELILGGMTEEEARRASDNDLRELLAGRFHLKVSRRSVNLYRRAVEQKRSK